MQPSPSAQVLDRTDEYTRPDDTFITRRPIPAPERRAPAAIAFRSLTNQAGWSSFLPRSPWISSWSRTADTIAVLLVLIGIVAYGVVPGGVPQLSEVFAIRVSLKNAVMLGFFAMAWPAALTMAGAYCDDESATFAPVLRRVVIGCTVGSSMMLLVLVTSRTGLLGVMTVPIFWLGAVTATLLVRLATRTGVWFGKVRTTPKHLVIAGTGARAAALWQALQRHPRIQYDLIATVDLPNAVVDEALSGRPTISIDALETFCMRTVVDELVVALPVRSCYPQIERVLQICERAGVNSLYLADSFSPTIGRSQVTRSGGFDVVSIEVVHNDWRTLAKRAFDFVGALGMLTVLSPLFLILAIAVKATSAGPAVFAQERYGYRKRRFKMYKFRTMVVTAESLQHSLEHKNEATGPVFKIKLDPRITPLGRFLRRTSLDELPQLWNVLLGQMSFVGPRPLAVRDVRRFNDAWLMRRFSVPPGLTCLWQIGGRSNVSFDEWMRLDLEYIDRWSLFLDMQILLRTVPAVLNATGAT